MILEVTILTISVLANFIIVSLTYLRNPRSATHRLLVALGLVLSIWSIINFISVKVYENPYATWLVRLVMVFSVPIGILFWLLVKTYPSPILKISRRHFFIVMSLMIVTMGVALSPALFPTVTPVVGQPPQTTPGLGMILYIPVVIFSILYGLFILIKKYFQAEGLLKVQTGYLLIGVTTMFTLIIGFIFVAVNIFHTAKFIPYGALFTIPFTGLTAYSMIRYRLMDIRLALFRILSSTALVGAVLLIYGILILFAVPWVSAFSGISNNLIAAASALISIPIARVLHRTVMKLTDRFLFQNRANYQKSLVAIAQDLAGTIRMEEVTPIILDALTKILRSSTVVVLLQNENSKEFRPQGVAGLKNFSLTIPLNNPIVAHLRHTRVPMVKMSWILLKNMT